MDARPAPFRPPAPKPRTSPPSLIELIRVVYRNPLELWGEPSYNEPWISVSGVGGPLVIANDPGLIRHVLVDNQQNYKMARVRQKILRPILRDGLLTAEGDVWKRSRRALAPVFTPRHIRGFAEPMLHCAERFADGYQARRGAFDLSHDMTQLTYEILAETLFSNEIAGEPDSFGARVERLLETMGRVDPLDLLAAPDWLPRLTRLRGRSALAFFRQIVSQTMQMRRDKMDGGGNVPDDFLTLLLAAEKPDGLTRAEVEDNIITFIGAGHETTARALGWTFYCLANAPEERARIEDEVDRVTHAHADPYDWLDAMPHARAAFEEALRLYPPAPSINREAVAPDRYKTLDIKPGTQVLVMPWTVHRHRLYWDDPEAFVPSRFWPENRDRIDRFQYLPFGVGPRICIGAAFAMQEAIIAMASLMKRWRFDMAPGAPQPWPVQKLTTQPQGGLQMVVSPR